MVQAEAPTPIHQDRFCCFWPNMIDKETGFEGLHSMQNKWVWFHYFDP